MPEGVIFTGALAERVVDATEWTERHAGRRGLAPAPPPAAEPVVCRVTSGTADGNGNYPAVVTAWSAQAAAWADFAAVKLKPANGETLVSGRRYLARPAGRTGSDEVYVAASGGGACVVTFVTNICEIP